MILIQLLVSVVWGHYIAKLVAKLQQFKMDKTEYNSAWVHLVYIKKKVI